MAAVGVSILNRFRQRRWIIRTVELGDYLPIQEAARLYRVSDDTLYRLLAAGKLRRYRRESDKRTWLKRSELEAMFTPKPVDE
jgi:excisionase family DNA binding protein